ncbi:MAG TPA: CHAT domain-containing protein, partial [Blastocatellia bacterium]|nr:CHAT domain-containing protein [Blastocatellia bacterium]
HPQPLSLPEIQHALDPDTLLLEYSLGNPRSYLWVAGNTSISSYELPDRGQIEQAARDFYDLLIAPGLADNGQKTGHRTLQTTDAVHTSKPRELSQILLGPAISRLGTKRLVVVTDGALDYIPFAALPEPGTADGQPLAVNHEIVSLPSVSVLSALRRELAGRSPAPKAIAVLADPVFEKDDPRVRLAQHRAGAIRQRLPKAQGNGEDSGLSGELRRAASETRAADSGLRFERLPSGHGEAVAIAGLVPAGERKIALDFDASLQTAMSPDLAQYRIIHFDTHGLLDSVHPELSGMVLSLVDRLGRPQDGFLRLNEIYNLKLPADLVVLGACETALGKEVRGEGLIALTRGFIYAGAARVMASLWRVDDHASAELMKYFYRGVIRQGLTPAAALRAAQLEMWRQDRWNNPYYWAGFVLQGEWK